MKKWINWVVPPILITLFVSVFADLHYLRLNPTVYEGLWSGICDNTLILCLSCVLLTMSVTFFCILIFVHRLNMSHRYILFWLSCLSTMCALWFVSKFNLAVLQKLVPGLGESLLFSSLNLVGICLGILFTYYEGNFGICCNTVCIYLLMLINAIGLVGMILGVFTLEQALWMPNIIFPLHLYCNAAGLAISARKGNHNNILIHYFYSAAVLAMTIDMLVSRITRMPNGTLTVIFILVFVNSQLYFVLRDINKAIVSDAERAEMERERLQNQMGTLLSQIQPHFIFNSLNAITDLVVTNPEEAEEALIQFSKYLRSNISFLDGKEKVRLTEEMSIVDNYFAMEKLRFGEAVNLQVDLKKADFEVPMLSIQPLVENAVKHGLRAQNGGGTVVVTSHEEDNHNIVMVQDDGAGFDVNIIEKKEGSVGIHNVMQRVKLVSGGTVEFTSEIGIGTTVKICLPK